jgi:hypothetical protein
LARVFADDPGHRHGPAILLLQQAAGPPFQAALLAVSTMVACAHGPAAALAGARLALKAFRAWVAEQPARP